MSNYINNYTEGNYPSFGSLPSSDNGTISESTFENFQVLINESIDSKTTFSNPITSTFSLIYTTTYSYAGSILDPHGYVHFVPNNAQVGQKISSSGVVSTYSLAYTTTNAFSGAAMLANGDIYFGPNTSNIGQKISSLGIQL